jgi:hypothetical protein
MGRLLSLTAVALAPLGLLAGGCSGPPGARVRGQVLLDGQPLAGAVVRFWPKDDLELGVYRGKAGPDGTFELEGRDGNRVKPGRYIVLITRDVKKDGTVPTTGDDWMALAAPGALRNTLPAPYSDRSNPPFTVAVTTGDNQIPPFPLKTRP